jgi:hypothetical protein
MALVSQREYARRRGVTPEAIRKRTVEQGGPIPTHGRAKRIDEAEADALYEATMAPNGVANARFQRPGAAPEPEASGPSKTVLGNAAALWQARTAMLLTEAQLKRLLLEERRGLVVNRQTALAKAFAFARLFRDAWQAWPAHVGPLLAAQFELDATAVTVALEEYVREHLEQLSRERFEL